MSAARRSRLSTKHNYRNAPRTPLFSGSKVTKPTNFTSPLGSKAKYNSKTAVTATKLHDAEPDRKLNAKSEIFKNYSIEERQALQLTDNKISHYWKMKERENLASNIHQSELNDGMKILRLFDISSQYGPCIGISRSKRWARANRLGLSPPIEVLAVLLKRCTKDVGNLEQAYVDELIS